MKKEFEEYITHHTEQALGDVNKVLINSALVSAQNRNRYYWTNWHVEQPEDKGIVLADIIEQSSSKITLKQYPRGNNPGFEKEVTKAPTMTSNSWEHNIHILCGAAIRGREDGANLETRKDEKSNSILSNGHQSRLIATIQKVIPSVERDKQYRKLTPRECARLQTIPEGIIDNMLNCRVSNTQLYKMLGNGWTVDVVAHIYSQMELPKKKI